FGLLREDQEDGLGHILGQVLVFHLAQGGGIDQVDVAVDELRKGVLGAGGGVLNKELLVVEVLVVHGPISRSNVHRGARADGGFLYEESGSSLKRTIPALTLKSREYCHPDGATATEGSARKDRAFYFPAGSCAALRMTA